MRMIEPDQLPPARREVIDSADRVYRWTAVVWGNLYAWMTIGIDGPLYVRTGMRGRHFDIAFVDREGVVHANWQRWG